MASANTNADSIELRHSGAASNDAAQANDQACTGNFCASTEAVFFDVTRTSAIANITIDLVAGANGEGNGTLTVTGASTLTWTPPGGSAGTAVTILNGEVKVLEGGGGATDKFIRISRTSATALTGTETTGLAYQAENAVFHDNVTSAERVAGDTRYWALGLRNASASGVTLVKVWIATLATQRTSDGGQLGGAGAGTITTTGSFADWPTAGWCHIRTGGTTREIVYFSSRTTTVLTVPALGRALLGTTAAAGANTDTLDCVPPVRIGKEAPASQPAGAIQTIANDAAAPTAITWNTGIASTTGLDIGTLNTGEWYGLWLRREIPAGANASAEETILLNMSYDA